MQICSLYMFRQTANYCFIVTQIFNTFPNRKYHKLQQYDNILWIEYNENCTCIHKAIIINYFAMETQFSHLLAFHSLCGLVHFKMVHYLNIVNSFIRFCEDSELPYLNCLVWIEGSIMVFPKTVGFFVILHLKNNYWDYDNINQLIKQIRFSYTWIPNIIVCLDLVISKEKSCQLNSPMIYTHSYVGCIIS